MAFTYFHGIYKDAEQPVFSSRDSNFVWNDYIKPLHLSFVGFLQVFSDKTELLFSSLSFTTYPIHDFFAKMSPSKRYWLMNNGYKIIGFLPISVSYYDVDEKDLFYELNSAYTDRSAFHVALDDDIRLTSSSNGGVQNMLFLQEALARALDLVEKRLTTALTC